VKIAHTQWWVWVIAVPFAWVATLFLEGFFGKENDKEDK